jgi:MFS family permease
LTFPGWNQAANGNLGWPKEFDFSANVIKETDHDTWEFGLVNAVMWFAAMIGPVLVDIICNTTSIAGRRGSVLVAAVLSLVGTVGSSRSQTWRQLLGWRIILGIGIGAKASIIPIWESEVLPPAKRGRVLVSWQVFVAIGLLTGNGATYYFGDSETQWRYQILTGAIPALILLVLVYIGCESPRWLVVRGEYLKAFETLVQLRQERLLAAEEFCYTYFQIQAERAAARKKTEPDFSEYQPRIGYLERLWQLLKLVRNRRALLATIIVMMTQHLSGIK